VARRCTTTRRTSYTNDLWSLQLPAFARAEQYGAGCVGSIGAPGLALVAPSTPVIGTTMNLQVSNVPGVIIPAIGAMGYSRTSWLGLPLPFDLAPLGWPGCQQLVSTVETVAAITTTSTAQTTVPVPYLPPIVGVAFHAQAFVLYHPSGVAVSNALTARALGA